MTQLHAPTISPGSLYAAPREVTSPEDCWFYHTIDIPGIGEIKADWDLRAGVESYLGAVDLRGKRVLEMGTANGFLCFHMEKRGAEVVAYDLSSEHDWDAVPYEDGQTARFLSEYRAHINQLNNAYWLAHRAFESKAKVVYGTVYEVPEAIGPVDIATFGCILLHVRDPFLALSRALRLVRETVIITEFIPPPPPVPASAVPLWRRLGRRVKRWLKGGGDRSGAHLQHFATPALGPSMVFLPDANHAHPRETWWNLSPDVIKRFLGVLGFGECKVTFHTQTYKEKDANLFTVVADRSQGGPK